MTDELYSEMILELFKHPANKGTLEQRTLHCEGGNPLCGDKIGYDVLVEDGKVKDIRFQGTGCAISTASASLLTTLVQGKTLEEVQALGSKEMFAALGNVIQTRIKCALLGLSVLKQGLQRWKHGKQEIITGLMV